MIPVHEESLDHLSHWHRSIASELFCYTPRSHGQSEARSSILLFADEHGYLICDETWEIYELGSAREFRVKVIKPIMISPKWFYWL